MGGVDDSARDLGPAVWGTVAINLRTLTTEVGPESVHTAESVPDGRCPGTPRRPVARVSMLPDQTACLLSFVFCLLPFVFPSYIPYGLKSGLIS